jgi:hypothetical protein
MVEAILAGGPASSRIALHVADSSPPLNEEMISFGLHMLRGRFVDDWGIRACKGEA